MKLPSAMWTWSGYGPLLTDSAFPPCILAGSSPHSLHPVVSLCQALDYEFFEAVTCPMLYTLYRSRHTDGAILIINNNDHL